MLIDDCKKFYNSFIEIISSPIKHISSCDEILGVTSFAQLKYFASQKANGRTILLVPSLINKSDILDITPTRSLCNFLKQNHDVYLIDWLTPKSDLVIEDYIKKINSYIRLIKKRHLKKITLIGYCLGGNLSLAALAHSSQNIEKLVLIATPWDFSKISYSIPFINQFLNAKLIPANFISLFYNSINLDKIILKYIKFYDNNSPSDSDEVELFFQVEKWTNNGIDLPVSVAKQINNDFFINNKSLTNEWSVLGKKINPEEMTVPSLVITASDDKIVPRESTLVLAKILKNCQLLESSSGHIGVIISKKSYREIWQPLIEWIG